MDTNAPSDLPPGSGPSGAPPPVAPPAPRGAGDSAPRFGRRVYDAGPERPRKNAGPFRKRHPVVFWGGLLLILYCLGAALWDRAADSGSNPLGREYIAVINVEGFIGDTEKSLAWIERLARDKKVKGALLRVNSPGGGAAASRELHDALKRLAEAKPLYASMGSVAASGGLMAASAATRVFANPSTITGSIGVKMEIPQVQGLMEKLGLRRESLASGRYKDAGTPFRPMTPEERAYLADIVEDMHRQFVALLCRDRNIPEEKLLPVADGRILTGAKALELGLVDELGGRDEALRRLRAAAGVTEDAPLLEQPRKGHFLRGLLESLLGADSGFGPLVPEFLHLY